MKLYAVKFVTLPHIITRYTFSSTNLQQAHQPLTLNSHSRQTTKHTSHDVSNALVDSLAHVIPRLAVGALADQILPERVSITI